VKYVTYSHRSASAIVQATPHLAQSWDEIVDVLSKLTDADILNNYNATSSSGSLSKALRSVISDSLVTKYTWARDIEIIQKLSKTDRSYTADLLKPRSETSGRPSGAIIQFSFGHYHSVTDKLVETLLATNQSSSIYEKVSSEGIGFVISATSSLQKAGGLDSSVGTFERIQSSLVALQTIVTVPIVLIGLEAPDTFQLNSKKQIIKF